MADMDHHMNASTCGHMTSAPRSIPKIKPATKRIRKYFHMSPDPTHSAILSQVDNP